MGFRPRLKGLLFWLVFLALYGLYKALPVFPLSIIAGVNESIFQHWKAGFFSYQILSLIEYAIYRKRIQRIEPFVYSRLLTALVIPWLIFLMWYIVPALYGRQLPLLWMEVAYGNLITLLVGYLAQVLESGFAQIDYPRPMKAVLLGLTIVALGLFLVFTFGPLPWADVFVEPNWH